jgi:hypothetical protein
MLRTESDTIQTFNIHSEEVTAQKYATSKSLLGKLYMKSNMECLFKSHK